MRRSKWARPLKYPRGATGEPKEIHESRLGAVGTVLDVRAYVDDFNTFVVDAYRRGVADAELPSESGVARSIIPPGTAATRDFSGLAPTIPTRIRSGI